MTSEEKKLAATRKLIERALFEIKGWPLRTPAKVVLGQATAMVFAAQESIEQTGGCWHHCVLVGDSQVRFNAMVQHPDFDDDREMIQKHKVVTWMTVAQLFNVLDSDVLLWLNDAWISVLDVEAFETGEWEWPKDDPNRKEALQLTILTPTKSSMLMCEYERDGDVIHWGEFQRAKGEEDTAFSQAMAPLIDRYRFLAPRDGQRRGDRLVMDALSQPGALVETMRGLGHHVASVDDRYLRMN